MTAFCWRWRRAVPVRNVEAWRERLRFVGEERFVVIEFPPPQKTARLEVYVNEPAVARSLTRHFGGRSQRLATNGWLKKIAGESLIRISRQLVVARTPTARRTWRQKHPDTAVLEIPSGLAFGTGEHGTTAMLLRRVWAEPVPAEEAWLDVGTGSGILALAARKRGAPHMVGLDFDPVAIRVARENEQRNFSRPLISWVVGDVRRWSPRRQFSRITANLFSELLIASAPRMWRWLKPGGELWLSGILRPQAAEVRAAFAVLGAETVVRKRIGKWVMLILRKETGGRLGPIDKP